MVGTNRERTGAMVDTNGERVESAWSCKSTVSTAGLGDHDGSYGTGGPWWGSVRMMVAIMVLRGLGDHGGHCGARIVV